MRNLIGVCLAIGLVAAARDKHPAAPRAGIQTPGVQIPFASLKAEAEVATGPAWIAMTTGVADSLLLPNAAKGALDRLDLEDL